GAERRTVTKGQIERGEVLAKALRLAAGRRKTRGAARQHGLGSIDAMEAEACVEQRDQHPTRARHRLEYCAGVTWKARGIPRELVVRGSRAVGGVGKEGQRGG